MQFVNSIFASKRFLLITFVIAVVYILSFFFESLFPIGHLLGIVFVLFCFLDLALLFSRKNGLDAKRYVADKFSNGFKNSIQLEILSSYPINISVDVVEELPYQMRSINFKKKINIDKHSQTQLTYDLVPKERGDYSIGNTILMAKNAIGIFKRRFIIETKQTVSVLPAFSQTGKFDLKSFKSTLIELGNKKTRRLGHSSEFEQIKGYVIGDNYKHVNWKASAKMNSLMVNQYIDEKSQQVYSIIDCGKSMQMPFDDLSLLDYSINSSLSFSHFVIRNQDKVGLICFNKKVSKILPPSRNSGHIDKIMNTLYNINTEFNESDYGNLYLNLKKHVSHRSLLMLYTNFEDLNSMHRQLRYLKAIAKSHVLVVVIFINTTLDDIINNPASNTYDFYLKSVCEKYSLEKRIIIKELEKHGINTVFTKPKNLSISTVNKYLEIKSRGII